MGHTRSLCDNGSLPIVQDQGMHPVMLQASIGGIGTVSKPNSVLSSHKGWLRTVFTHASWYVEQRLASISSAAIPMVSLAAASMISA